jgi:hypothetical protein
MHNDALTKTLTSGAAAFGILAGLSIIPLQAQAADFKPPAWRGQPLTTVQEWEFNTNPPVAIGPDGDIPTVNPGGPTATPGPGIIGGAMGDDKSWGTSLAGAKITFDIPNFIDTERRKDMWVQVTVGQGDTFTIGGLSADPPPVTITTPSITRIINPPGFDDTKYDFYLAKWQIFPNPASEKFDLILGAGTNVYEVVVDTISTPEPTSILGFLALGTLGAASTLKRKLKSSKSEEN